MTSTTRSSPPALSDVGPELVFALIGATGTNLDAVSNELRLALTSARYIVENVRISYLLDVFFGSPRLGPLYDRVSKQMDSGNELRQRTGRFDAAALLALITIRARRRDVTESPTTPAPRRAYIVRSLKRPEEVDALRSIYGSRLFVIAAYSPRRQRSRDFARELAGGNPKIEDFEGQAEELIRRDESEVALPYGQRLRDTFTKADVFLNTRDSNRLRADVMRIVQVLFGNPFQTPTKDEFGMSVAFMASLRSSDISRQVGAAITDNLTGEVLALGTNEIPRANGGQYWYGDVEPGDDERWAADSGVQSRVAVLEEVLTRFREAGWLSPDLHDSAQELATRALLGPANDHASPLLNNSLVAGLTEFGRAVHAEMFALTDAAARGTAIRGATLYSTTFPCHNCAKHILASGLSRVVYIEPYPRSLTAMLYPASVELEPTGHIQDRIPFEPYIGVAPRRYSEFFEHGPGARKDIAGRRITWDLSSSNARFVNNTDLDYLSRESEVVELLEDKLRDAGIMRE